MERFFTAVLLILLMPLTLFSQGFVNVAQQQGILINTDGSYGSGVSFYDYNMDGWADLSFPTNGNGIQRFRNEQGSFVPDTPISIDASEYEMAAYADFDNDGDKDVYICKSQMGSYLFENVDGVLIDVSVEAGLVVENATTQGACWGDYDLDGYLDLYVTNYDADTYHNWLFHNNTDGTFTEVSETSGVDDGFRSSFQGVWMDYNRDLFPDLFVVNDRSIFTNAMYRNNGDGTFTDVSSELELDLGFDAMCGTVADVDYDGDLDIYCTNDPNGNKLFLNNENGFEEVAVDWGLALYEESWGSAWVDSNNDMIQDLIVCKSTQFLSDNQPFYLGVSEEEYVPFEDVYFGGANSLATGVAMADFNHDGYTDLTVQAIAPDASQLWRNTEVTKGSVSLELEGVVSNKEAVGVWVDYWADNKQRTLYTMNGGSYLSQNETRLTLPTNNGSGIDSIRIEWPSGIIDTHYDLQNFEFYTFLEGSSFQAYVQSDQNFFCPGDSLELRADPGLSVEWSNGSTTPSISINQPGAYFYNFETSFGTTGVSDFVFIQTSQIPDVSYDVLNQISCYGASDGIVELNVTPNPNSVHWSNGTVGLYSDSLSAGIYTANIEDMLGCLSQFDFQLSNPDSLQLELTTIPVSCYGNADGLVTWNPSGGTGNLEITFDGLDPTALEAGIYEVVLEDSNGCIIEEDFAIAQPDSLTVVALTQPAEGNNGSIELNITGGVPDYEVFWSNGQSGISLEGLDPGLYFYTITDMNNCTTMGSVEVDIFIGVSANTQSEIIIPNPVTSVIQIHNSSVIQQYQLITSNGRLIATGLNPSTDTLRFEELESGVYFFSYLENGIAHRRKIMVTP